VLVCTRYGPSFPAGSLVYLGNSGGFSGARLWRGDGPLGPFCLRAWPAGETVARALGRHRLMIHARSQGLAWVPEVFATTDGSTVLEAAGRVWEMTAWLPGRADFSSAPTRARLQAACAALAHLHRAWEDFAEPAAPCPAVDRRLGLLTTCEAFLRSAPRPSAGDLLLHPLAAVMQRAWRVVPPRLAEIPELLSPWRTFCEPVQPCLCDVWHDNLLFMGDRLGGIVDYGSVKIDHVAVDLARLLGSLVGDDATGWTVGLAAYRAVRPLTDRAEGLGRALDRTGLVLAAANWLVRLATEPREAEELARAVHRLEGLLERMERLEPRL